MNNIEWIIQQHKNCNHRYYNLLPYEFHLELTHQTGLKFKHLLDNSKDYYHDFDLEQNRTPRKTKQSMQQVCLTACWGHDLLEDTHVSYNDIKERVGQAVADVIYAVTNEKGKTRLERANVKYYEGIRNTPGAVFVKLCDRIANVKFGVLVNAKMLEKYKNENEHFEKMLGRHTQNQNLEPMFVQLENLLNF